MSAPDFKTDSLQGIAHLMDWARAHGYVLYPSHREVARKHGVSTAGVAFADPLPTDPPK